MAFRRPLPRLIETSAAQPQPQSVPGFDAPPLSGLLPSGAASRDWPTDETGILTEVLRCHGLPTALIDQLIGVATAPQHAARMVDRLAVALAAHFHFLPLEEALQAPMLLYGVPGSGVSTLAAKLAARFDERQILVVSTGGRAADDLEQLEEYLEVLDLPLAVAADVKSLKLTVAGADGRKVIIDTACGSPTDAASADQIRKFTEAAGAESVLVIAANAAAEEAAALGRAAAHIGTRRMIITQIDTERFIGAALIAADAGKLALVAARVTPHFAFGLRTLTPENLARRLMSAVLRSERWRIAPL